MEDCRVIWHMGLKEIHPCYFNTFQLWRITLMFGKICIISVVLDKIKTVSPGPGDGRGSQSLSILAMTGLPG